jgi:hypothetical protein
MGREPVAERGPVRDVFFIFVECFKVVACVPGEHCSTKVKVHRFATGVENGPAAMAAVDLDAAVTTGWPGELPVAVSEKVRPAVYTLSE